MKQRRHGLDDLGQAKGLHALEEVLARASALVQRGLCPRELQVLACPLLHEGRGKGAYQAQGDAEELEDVDADGGRGRAEGRVAVERRGRDLGAAGERGELLRYLVQQEDGCGVGIGGQTLVALHDERCYGGGEEAGLWHRGKDRIVRSGARGGDLDIQR